MENQSLSSVAKNSKGSIIAATIVGLAVVSGAASSIVDTPKAEEPIKTPSLERSVQGFTAETDGDVIEEDQAQAEQVDSAVVPEPIVAPLQKTITPVSDVPSEPVSRPAPSCSCPYSDLDCKDFSSGPAAQRVYECCLEQGRGDYHDLDRDSDGTACDTLW